MNEIMTMPAGETAALQQATVEIRRMSEMMATMAAMLQATTESMEALRRQVRLLEKVTPAQAGAINRAIRERSTEICELYMAKGGEKLAASQIRKAVKAQFGAGAVKEVPRCDFEVAIQQVRGWDDYKVMKGIREKVRANG